MNKLIVRTMMVLAVAVAGALPAPAQTRIATVDFKKVVNGYWKTKEATVALKDRREDLLKELKGLGEDIKKAEEEYKKLVDDANDAAISAGEKEKRKLAAEARLKSITELKERAREFDRNASATLNEQAQRMADRIDEKIRATVSARAKASGFTLVFDTSARGLEQKQVVVYSSDENDLTAAVLEQINADAPPETKQPAEKVEKKDGKK